MLLTDEDIQRYAEEYDACTEFDFEDVSANPENNYYLCSKNVYGEFGEPIPVAIKFAPIHETAPMWIEMY